jgi:hypothetical protein
MKQLPIFKTFLLIAAVAFFGSCQKETLPDINNQTESVTTAQKQNQQLPFKGSFSTFFNFIPDIAGGWVPPNPAPAWYPGGGSGNLTHVGICQTYFNQYATFGPVGLQSVGAPVNMFFAGQLVAAGYTVPNTVSTIYFTSNGKSVWSQVVGISTTTPVSPTRVEFTANHSIIGGTGQFAGATGQYVLSGYFNPQNPQQAGFDVDGWISY